MARVLFCGQLGRSRKVSPVITEVQVDFLMDHGYTRRQIERWSRAGASVEIERIKRMPGKTPEAKMAWREEYNLYMKSEEWRARSRACIEASGGRCVLCNSDRGIHAHHRTYKNFKNETLDDLTALCAACHGRYHSIIRRKKNRRR